MSHDSSHPASVVMLLALVLLAHARAEWVEITQHKPSRNFHKTALPTTTTELYSDKKTHPQFSTDSRILGENRNRVYINHSLEPPKHWSKGVVHRVPNLGNVKRIYLTTEEPARSKYEETDLSIEFTNSYTTRNPFKKYEERIPEFVTKEETFEDDDEIEELHFVRKPAKDTWSQRKETVTQKNVNKPSIPVRRADTEETEPVVNKNPGKAQNSKGQHGKSPTENDAKVNTIENVMKFVKVVADTITRNTRRSFSSKLRYLEDLKDTIMVNIEDRIESLYPDDSGGAAARRRRWARSAEARGHVEFPSSESALMTISFLTFAVYLIKLVLQVIQTYKNKTMMVAPAVVAMGRAASNIQQITDTFKLKNNVN